MSFLWAIILLGILVFVHELGHFLVAKATGVKVLAFSLGFGPKIVGVQLGETEYKICAVPLGGYVKLLGQEASEDIPPGVLALDPNGAAYGAGLRKGDTIVAIDDNEVNSWKDVQEELALYRGVELMIDIERAGKRFNFVVPRIDGDEPEEIMGEGDEPSGIRLPEIGLTIGHDPSELERAFFKKPLWARFLVVFAGPAASLLFPILIYFVYFLSVDELTSNRISQVIEGTPAAAADLQPGDRIVAVDGKETPYWSSMSEIVQASAGKQLTLTVDRDGQKLQVPITPAASEVTDRLGDVHRLGRLGVVSSTIPALVGAVKGSPADKAGIGLGDRVLELNGQKMDFIWQLEQQLEEIRISGRAVALKIQPAAGEDGTAPEPKFVKLVPEAKPDGSGFVLGLHSADSFVGRIKDATPAAEAGIQTGDRVLKVNGNAVSAWVTVEQALREAVSRDAEGKTQIAPITLTLQRGDESYQATITQREEIRKGEFQEEIPHYVFGAFSAVKPSQWLEGEFVPVQNRFAYAASGSLATSWEITAMTVAVFGKLFTGELSFKMLGGPIMIFDVAGKAAERGWQYYLWVMALISINLGLLNLLPVPVLDGGHLMFFTIEGIMRRPLNQRLKERATMVGFIMLMTLMVLVMKNDIERYWDVIFG